MKINIYPISSSLHTKASLDSHTKALLEELKERNITYHFVNNLTKFYEDADISLILVQSGGSENVFKQIYTSLKEPYYLLTYGTNNSLAASLEILSFLHNNHLEGEVLHGSSNYLAKRLEIINQKAHKKLDTSLGLIGRPSDWLIGFEMDTIDKAKKFGMNFTFIPIEEVERTYQAIEDVKIFTHLDFDKEALKDASKLYQAIKKIKDEYHLDALTIRCFDLLKSLRTTACLALAKLNDESTTAACEGDIPSLIAMHIVRKVLGLTSFQANPSKIDVTNSIITLAHCTIPFSMCEKISLDTHFESGIGVGIHGEIKPQKATIFRLNANLDQCYIEEGEILSNQYELDLCRTQINCRFPRLDKILTHPLGNHEIIILGHHKRTLLTYLKQFNIEEI